MTNIDAIKMRIAKVGGEDIDIQLDGNPPIIRYFAHYTLPNGNRVRDTYAPNLDGIPDLVRSKVIGTYWHAVGVPTFFVPAG